jgi:hypothetical protein
MKNQFFLVSFILSAFTINLAVGQGCSDAGICTAVDALKPSSNLFQTNEKASIGVGAGVGLADNGITVFNQYVQGKWYASNKLNFDLRLTSIAQSGAEYTGFGLSDVYINTTFKLKQSHATIGFKLPLANGNHTHTIQNLNTALPMDYQASMGTTDLLLGLAKSFGNISLNAGFQNPLTQNKNTFVNNVAFAKFETTNQYQRASDVMLRVAYSNKQKTKKIKITPALLAIYHTANDKYTNTNGEQNDILDSKGLTLNANLFADYSINKTQKLQASLGAPLVARKVRPDGLTRLMAFNIQYTLSVF